ncbi:NAD(P)-dependent alcohol dehydrogenase [Microbacterium sp. NPDC058062]|uniref:NAD(P)-dependent alcohol dehydrogenase n=1 Tax=Microbacterium sp. NPDC058062 TaxID=3346320 RepID=UPI0036DC1C3F
MKAARLHTLGAEFVVEDVPIPVPGPGEVRIRVGAAGACHSDLHIKSGGVKGVDLPHTLGHENAGWVDAFGAGAEGQGLSLGDAVVVFGGWGCGHCHFCLGGTEQLCDRFRWGGMGPEGGYAEYLIVPSVRHLIPAGGLHPADAAPLTDAALTPYSAVKKTLSRLVPGTSAVLIGAGGLGQYGVQFLKMLTPSTVIVVDNDPHKRELALELGADVVVDPSAESATRTIWDATDARGAAAVIDFVGVDATLATAAAVVGRQGIVVVVGLGGGSVRYSFFGLAQGATLTSSSWGSRNELEEVLTFAQKGDLVSHIERFPLAAINDVFGRLHHGDIVGRAVLIP